jgi:hypothetical protein
VIGVTSEGQLLLHLEQDGAEKKVIRVRQWGYEAEPELLSYLVLGRKVTCVILYNADEFLGGECSLSYFPEYEAASEWRDRKGLSSVSDYYGGSVTYYLNQLKVGSHHCNEDDRRLIAETPNESPHRRDHYLGRCDYFDQLNERK